MGDGGKKDKNMDTNKERKRQRKRVERAQEANHNYWGRNKKDNHSAGDKIVKVESEEEKRLNPKKSQILTDKKDKGSTTNNQAMTNNNDSEKDSYNIKTQIFQIKRGWGKW